MLSQDITGALLAVTMIHTNYANILMMPRVIGNFTIQVGAMIRGKHSDMD